MKVLSECFWFSISGMVKYNPMRASSYLPLPKELKAETVCLNFQNNDKKCFLRSILALLHPNRVLIYQEYEHELNMSGIQYPVVIKDIGKFEHQNNITVNVYGYEDKEIFQWRIISVTIARDHVNLLCITAGEKSQYELVKDLRRLVSSQYNNHNSKHHLEFAWLHQSRGIGKPYRIIQVTWGTKNQVPRSWRQEGTWQSQVYKIRIPMTFTC